MMKKFIRRKICPNGSQRNKFGKYVRNKIRFGEMPINLRYDLKKGDSKMKIFKTIYLNIALIIKRKFF